mmetsp:Transcript_6362/g.15729  ORF Transcript_6362/g.15729 Transcript_6362/m.15729 type:complete len:245 (+) Transcript_6362:285-1019(+)
MTMGWLGVGRLTWCQLGISAPPLIQQNRARLLRNSSPLGVSALLPISSEEPPPRSRWQPSASPWGSTRPPSSSTRCGRSAWSLAWPSRGSRPCWRPNVQIAEPRHRQGAGGGPAKPAEPGGSTSRCPGDARAKSADVCRLTPLAPRQRARDHAARHCPNRGCRARCCRVGAAASTWREGARLPRRPSSMPQKPPGCRQRPGVLTRPAFDMLGGPLHPMQCTGCKARSMGCQSKLARSCSSTAAS